MCIYIYIYTHTYTYTYTYTHVTCTDVCYMYICDILADASCASRASAPTRALSNRGPLHKAQVAAIISLYIIISSSSSSSSSCSSNSNGTNDSNSNSTTTNNNNSDDDNHHKTNVAAQSNPDTDRWQKGPGKGRQHEHVRAEQPGRAAPRASSRTTVPLTGCTT